MEVILGEEFQRAVVPIFVDQLRLFSILIVFRLILLERYIPLHLTIAVPRLFLVIHLLIQSRIFLHVLLVVRPVLMA